MILRGLTSTGDWQFGKGLSDYTTEAKAIALNIQMKLNSFLNDCFFDMTAGTDWFNLLGGKSQKDIQNAVYSALSGCYGVSEITSVSTSFVTNTRILNLSYSVKTIYDTDINNTVQIGGIYA